MIEYKTVSLANQVFEKLEVDILSGKYKRGDVVSENMLKTDLGVSRTPVREALSRLSQEGLIADSPNGSIVLGVTDADVDDFYVVKWRIEPLTCARAAENITEEELAELKNIVDQQEFYQMKGDPAKVSELDTQFHDKIYQSCGSPVLIKVLSPLHHKMMRYREISLKHDEERLRLSVEEHQAILAAIQAHDKKLSSELMTKHVNNAYKSIVESREKREK